MNPRFTLAVGALALGVAFPVLAVDIDRDTVLVTATRQATRANELLSDVSVISREDIEQSGQSTVEQLLAQQPGIEYSANGGPGTSSGVFIRGANSSHTLVLIDGQRAGSVSDGSMAFSRLPLDQIERIEVLRGPASSLYGSDAIGGVIQIFTRRGEGAARFNGSAGFGSNHTSEVTAGVSGGTEALSYRVQAGYFDTTGFSAINDPANGSFNPDKDGYRNKNVSANIAFRPAPGHELGISLFNSAGVSDYDSGPAIKSSTDHRIGNYAIYLRNRMTPEWTSTVRVGRSTDDSTELVDGSDNGFFRTDQDQVSWQNDIKLPVGKLLLAAESLKQKLTSDATYLLNERTNRSLLAGWSGALDDHRLQLNVRRDENSQFGGRTTGAVAYGYQFTSDWRGHVSYGTAFRAPTFNNLYFPQTCYPGWGCFGGNANLRPELAKNAEAGVDWETAGQHFSAVYFHNKVSDLIDSSLPVPLNVNRATLRGLSLGYSGTLGAWDLGTLVDLQRARDDETGNRLARRADRQLKAHLAYNAGALKVGGEWRLVGDRFDNATNTKHLGGYGLLNLFADYRLDKDWSVFARVNNVFDKRYELAKDFATAGANVFVGIRYRPQ